MNKLLSAIVLSVIVISVNAQHVGIGTTQPKARLHVVDSAVLFSGSNTLPAVATPPPASGFGIRMMWYPQKAAFRSGLVTGSQWDKDSIGAYSFAAGYDAKAKGDASTALGNTTYAKGTFSIAIGSGSEALGSVATAIGNFNKAIGDYATALGSATEATGNYSLAMGKQSKAIGINSVAIGNAPTAAGTDAVALGSSSAAGNNAFAAGQSNHATGANSVAMGYQSTASGTASTAFGNSTVSKGTYTTSMGSNTTAENDYSTAMGYGSRASGTSSTALNSFTSARGNYSTAMGASTIAKAVGATTLGIYNDSTDNPSATVPSLTDRIVQVGIGSSNDARSNALTILRNGNVGIGTVYPAASLSVSGTFVSGKANNIYGDYAAAIGQDLASKAAYSLSIGSFNDVLDNPNPTIVAPTDRIFQIGNGTSFTYDKRSNALTVLRNGKMGLGVLEPNYIFDVNGRIKLRSTSGNTAGIWFNNPDNSAEYAFMGTNDDQTIGMYIGNSWRFLVNANGNATLSGTLAQNSDERLKTNIEPLQNSLEMISQLTGYHYQWKANNRDQELQTGVLAQEVEAQMPELVSTNNDGVKSVNYSGLVPYLIESTKSLKHNNESQSTQIELLKQQNIQLLKTVTLLQEKVQALEKKN